jgi:DNA topoisomerase-1
MTAMGGGILLIQGMVNQYIKEHTGDSFTAKDFRTWAGCLNALRAFKI